MYNIKKFCCVGFSSALMHTDCVNIFEEPIRTSELMIFNIDISEIQNNVIYIESHCNISARGLSNIFVEIALVACWSHHSPYS